MTELEKPKAELQATLLRAIASRREIELFYKRAGSATGRRMVAPHALFRSGDGRHFLHAFQTEGVSDRGGLPDWRSFALESIAGATILSAQFEPREDYDPASKAYSAGLLASVH